MAISRKDSTKTWIGREIEGTLASFNDRCAFFLFLEHQFFEGLTTLASNSVEKFTTEVFSANPYASKIRVRLRDLQPFGMEHRSATFAAYFSSSYEIASSFMEKALKALKDFSRKPLTLREQENEGPEQFYWRTLVSWRLATPDEQLIDTLSFIRYRRNSLVHLDRVPSRSFKALTRRSGTKLNIFWKAAKLHIDFAIPETKPLEELETIDFLKLLRITIQRLDTHFSSVIDEAGLAKFEARRLFDKKAGRITLERRVRKLRKEIKMAYGLSPHEDDLRRAAQSVGTK